jgi:hypothetical protein
MLRNKADVRIGSHDFQIDQAVPNHYNEIIENLTREEAEVTGKPGVHAIAGPEMIWFYDDWSGGEGALVYNPDEPTVYDVGYSVNPRMAGSFTGRPNRTVATMTATDSTDAVMMCVGGGVLWIGGSREIVRTTAGSLSTVSDVDAGFDGGGDMANASYRITAMCGDHDGMYFAGYKNGGSKRVIRKLARDLDSGTITGSTVVAEADGAPIVGMAIMGGQLYLWTGRKLLKVDITASFPTTTSVVYDTGTELPDTNPFSTDWWADLVSTENSIFFFFSSDGLSHVYEFKFRNGVGVAAPVWSPPIGFTVKSCCYSQGKVFFFGHWGGSSNADGWGAGYVFPLDLRRPEFLTWFRRNQNKNLQMQACAPSYGDQVLACAERTGRIFVWDHELSSLTMLDDLESTGADFDAVYFTDDNDRIGGIQTFGPYRFVATYHHGSDINEYQVIRYDDDRREQREVGLSTARYPLILTYIESPLWDFGWPIEKKVLTGFYLTFKPLISGQTITVSYSVDDGDNWVAMTGVTSATAGASDAGRVFIQVSTSSATVDFHNLKTRVEVKSTTTVATPIVYSFGVGAKLKRKKRRWQLVIRVKDELNRTRPSNRKVNGPTIRDWLLDAATTGQVVTFLNGFRYHGAGTYTTHSVSIIEAVDVIEEAGEGSMRLLLEEVPEAS